VLAAGLLAVSTLATGCGAAGGGSAGSGTLSAAAVAERYGYDVESAELSPVFELVPEYKDPRDMYARELLLRECLRDTAEYRVPPPNSDPTAGPFQARTGQRVFDEQVAAQWGYQLTPPASTDRGFPSSVPLTEALHDEMSACGTRTAQRLGEPPEAALAPVESAGWAALTASSDLEAAASAWRECMSPAGIVDLPESPTDMPTPSVGAAPAAPGVATPGGVVPTSRERQVATLDARCREQVGYAEVELRVRAGGELAAIGRDIEGFEAARQDFAEYAEQIDQVIRELGG
jgi:hypothetical protein